MNKLMKASGSKSSPKATIAMPQAPHDDMMYRAKDALHTLKRAEEIQRDKHLMRCVKKCAKDEMKSLAKIGGARKK